MLKLFARSFSTRTKELKDSVVGTAKEIVKDAKKVSAAATQTLHDDFHSIGQAVASASERIDHTVRGTDQERFHAAEEAGKRAENEDRMFVFNEHAENPINKAAKMAHEAKENIKEKLNESKETIKDKIHGTKESVTDKMHTAKEDMKDKYHDTKDAAKSAYDKSKDAAIRAQHSNEGYSEPRESMTQKMEQMAENVIGKVKETVASVKDTLTGATPAAPKETPPTIAPMDAAKINPMGDTQNRDPVLKPQAPLSKETEELQKKGAERKAEEDSFNLM